MKTVLNKEAFILKHSEYFKLISEKLKTEEWFKSYLKPFKLTPEECPLVTNLVPTENGTYFKAAHFVYLPMGDHEYKMVCNSISRLIPRSELEQLLKVEIPLSDESIYFCSDLAWDLATWWA